MNGSLRLIVMSGSSLCVFLTVWLIFACRSIPPEAHVCTTDIVVAVLVIIACTIVTTALIVFYGWKKQ